MNTASNARACARTATRSRRTADLRLLVGGAGALLIAALVSQPVAAGQCPSGQSATNADHGRMTQPVGVTDTVVTSIDLGQEPAAIDGRAFRLRRLEIAPGGVVPWHSHADRPAIIYVVAGEVSEYSSGCKVPIVHRAGDATPELHTVSHRWRNSGTGTAVLLSADLLKAGGDAKAM
jgi:quercetin dioxygenase-like cupin family protein